MKTKLTFMLTVALLFAGDNALAQHVPQAERYRISTQRGQQALPQAPGYWADTFVAIASGRSPDGELHYVYNPLKSESEDGAKALAMEECAARGWQDCQVFFTGWNGYTAIARDERGGYHAGIGRSERSASKDARSSCRRQKLKCKVVYYVDARLVYKTF